MSFTNQWVSNTLPSKALRFRADLSFCLAIAFLITACENQDKLSEDGNQASTAPQAELALSTPEIQAFELLTALASEAEVLRSAESRARKALEDILFDPGSAVLRSLRSGRSGAVCGKLNGKNRWGAYVGFKDFVVTKDGVAFLSAYNDGISSVWTGEFADAYVTACASKKELADRPVEVEDSWSYDPEPMEATPPSRASEPDAVLDAPVETEKEAEVAPVA